MHSHYRMSVCVVSCTRLVTQQVQDAVARAEAATNGHSVAAAGPLRVEPVLGVCQLPLRSPVSRLGGRQQVTQRDWWQGRANDFANGRGTLL